MRFLMGLLFGVALGFAVTSYINQHVQPEDERPA